MHRFASRTLLAARLIFPLFLLTACAVQGMEAAQPPLAEARGMVSAADPRAAEAGREILRQGGSAADAAIATAIALTVVEPQSSGIGGGGFLVYHDAASRNITSFDGREEAPSAAGPGWFQDADGKLISEPMIGGRAVGVPGNIRMFELAHARHGALAWKQLFAPAIRLAREGFAISPRMHASLGGRTAASALTSWARHQFFGADGQPKPAGTVVTNAELAALLEGVAERGPDWFYTGPPARAIVEATSRSARNPAPMTLGDLATYDARQREVPCGQYRGYRICGMGPPSSGATTVFAILKQLERFDLAALGPDSPEAWHLIAESMRLAYADRSAYLGDPEHVRVPTAGLMDPAYLAARSRLIDPRRAMPAVAPGTPPGAIKADAVESGEVPSTSHLVAVDRNGNAASLTSTIESAWGSGLTVHGFYLNNELTDFTLVSPSGASAVANRVEGGKRPMSSMSPTIAYAPDGSVRLAVGAAGGPTIIMQVAKALIGVIDWKLSAQQAIALPGLYTRGGRVFVEADSALVAMIPALNSLGHSIVAATPPFKANAIEWTGGRWIGAADPRSEGVALGE